MADQALEILLKTRNATEAGFRDVQNQVRSLGDEMKNYFGNVVKGVVTFETLRRATAAMVDVFRDSVKAYAAAESAQAKLTAALIAQGIATPQVTSQYNALAKEFQRTTVFSDDLVTEMEALLAQIGGVMPHDMERALSAATDLAAGIGVDLRTATILMGKAFAGETSTLKRYGIVVDEAALATRGADAVIDAVAAKMGGQAAAQALTYAGAWQRIENAIDDVQESLGGLIVKDNATQLSMRTLTAILSGLTGNFDENTTAVDLLKEANEDFFDAVTGGSTGALRNLIATLNAAASAYDGVAGAVNRLSAASPFKALTTGGDIRGQLAANMLQAGGVDTVISQLNAQQRDVQRRAKEAADAVKRVVEAQDQFRESIYETAQAWKRLWFDLNLDAVRGLNELEEKATSKLAAITEARGQEILRAFTINAAHQKQLMAIGFAGLPTAKGKTAADMKALMGGGIFGGFAGEGGILAQLPATLLKTFQGGGNAFNAVGSLVGGQIGTNIAGSISGSLAQKAVAGTMSKALSSTLSTALGSAIPVVGALAGPLLSKLFGGLFGNKERQENLAATQNIDQLKTQLLDTYGSLANIKTIGDQVGVSLAEAFGSKGKKGLEHFKGLMAEFVKQHSQLTTALDRYGLSWEHLGLQAKQSNVDTITKTLIGDTKILQQAGVDYETIIRSQSTAYSDLFQSILRTGTEAPATLQPILEKLIEMGLLVDAEGLKVTNLGAITFQQLQADAITSLAGIEPAARQVAASIQQSFSRIDIPEIRVPYRFEREGEGIPAEGFQRGGYVPYTPGGRLVRVAERETERIVSDEQLARIVARAMVLAGGGAQRSMPPAVVVQIGGRTIKDVIVREVNDAAASGAVHMPTRSLVDRGF